MGRMKYMSHLFSPSQGERYTKLVSIGAWYYDYETCTAFAPHDGEFWKVYCPRLRDASQLVPYHDLPEWVREQLELYGITGESSSC